MTNIDDEWEKFISLPSNNSSDEYTSDYDDDNLYNHHSTTQNNVDGSVMDGGENAPMATNIYISTKTKIAYLNKIVDLKTVFWKIDVIDYTIPQNGVIKKQIKLNSNNKEELENIQSRLEKEGYFEEHVITHIDNPNGRIKFKDIRKISIGISRKDITSYRCKKKSAFYNCFVLILRMNVSGVFKEFHVKVFNTGKVEIPGVQNDETFEIILGEVLTILRPHLSEDLDYKINTNETVLINSNFNCGYFINREALYDILKYKYNIQAIYDPCSYPGIQCKFYYKQQDKLSDAIQMVQNKNDEECQEVSFMIFRTGSVLIVGKCDENVLMVIYHYLKTILSDEYKYVCQKNVIEPNTIKYKIKKNRRKTVMIHVTAANNTL